MGLAKGSGAAGDPVDPVGAAGEAAAGACVSTCTGLDNCTRGSPGLALPAAEAASPCDAGAGESAWESVPDPVSESASDSTLLRREAELGKFLQLCCL
jgi:hypothetical protein